MISNKTANEVYKALMEWAHTCGVPKDHIHTLLGGLARVGGNKSFTDSMLGLLRMFQNDGQEPERKPMSKAAKQNRIREGGDSLCPYCKAEPYEAEYGEIEAEEGGIFTQIVRCTECERRWKDEYKLIDVHELAG